MILFWSILKEKQELTLKARLQCRQHLTLNYVRRTNWFHQRWAQTYWILWAKTKWPSSLLQRRSTKSKRWWELLGNHCGIKTNNYHFHRSKFSHNGNKYIACNHSCIASACQCSPFDLDCSSWSLVLVLSGKDNESIKKKKTVRFSEEWLRLRARTNWIIFSNITSKHC